MKLYHVSMDFNMSEKIFVPRVPNHRCKNENGDIKRVCMSTSIKDAINGFPYKSLYVNDIIKTNEVNFLTYYEVNATNLKHLNNNDLKDFVPDVHLSKEHWILEDFKAVPNIIKVNNLKLQKFNRYINEYTGNVDDFIFEREVEDYDRENTITFLSKRNRKEAIKVANMLGIDYEILADEYNNLYHKKFVLNNKVTYKGTTKPYRKVKIRFNISKGINVKSLWNVFNNENEFRKRKKISLTPFILDNEDNEILIEMLSSGYSF